MSEPPCTAGARNFVQSNDYDLGIDDKASGPAILDLIAAFAAEQMGVRKR
jgi:hypothetical protein